MTSFYSCKAFLAKRKSKIRFRRQSAAVNIVLNYDGSDFISFLFRETDVTRGRQNHVIVWIVKIDRSIDLQEEFDFHLHRIKFRGTSVKRDSRPERGNETVAHSSNHFCFEMFKKTKKIKRWNEKKSKINRNVKIFWRSLFTSFVKSRCCFQSQTLLFDAHLLWIHLSYLPATSISAWPDSLSERS